ncbi:tRNA (guanine-N(7)-)-methyltransferase [Vallitalea longa]|uniref:tRNA (guanine-N(7)-)-methyltransferase n=1 Tax=Vallitalea longa TaxID=2936439 RepID=A0A9W5YE33_9FIRM|nr:tRNA (guanosine(46)-N7)-methyltransferase TrmB [Vallitalea longa]GKX30249.1 tRNA (guanine-N(7)-)-methyltransferase [Vallitalea longa]
MRLRNVKDSDKKISIHPKVVKNEKNYKGKWNKIFNNDNPIHIEIGMGKGKFITTLAKNNPNINYIGFEKFTKVLVRALKNLEEEDLRNVLVIRMDAEEILDVFQEGEIDRIYLNFSDPWPKDRHDKRRLTHHNFLEKYEKILSPDGRICFKTDNKDLFEFSLEEIEKYGWKVEKVTRDLHSNDNGEDNIMTEYEEKFVSMGIPISRLEAVKERLS